jgi:hypothetical protein
MAPITLLAAQNVASLFTASSGLEAELSALAAESNLDIPLIPNSQIYVSSAPASMADLQQELGFPRVSVYSSRLQNMQLEKFRSLSGYATVTVEMAITADMVSEVDTFIHFYVEAATNILQRNRGDWGNGICFFGAYDAQIQPPQMGVSGFVQLARIHFEIGVNRN